MKKSYLLMLIAMFITGIAAAQIVQVSSLKTSGSTGIASPYLFNGEIYFEGDNGDVLIGDELYKITTEGSVVLVKDINVDPDDTTPNSDPKRFIEYKGKLYFTANDGDVTGHDIELWVTDGTDAGTQMVYDIQPGLTKGSNPQEYFVFNDNLYFQPNDGSSTQWWKYNGIDVPVKVTNINGGLYASPTKAIVDNANNIVYFQANNPKTALHVMKTDETVELIDINPGGFGYNGSEAILYKGKLIFQGDDGTNGDELWISDGTFAGTSMILDINTTAAGNNSDPESFAIYNDTLYFVADPGTGTQLWKTDGTAAGTKMVAEPNAGMEGSVEELYVYNDKLYFAADDGTNGVEIWVYDGSTAAMLKNINVTGDSNPAGFMEVNNLLFFEANDGSGTKLWVSNGTAQGTINVAEGMTDVPFDVDAGEFVAIGTELFFTASNTEGYDFFKVNAEDLYSKKMQVSDLNTSGSSNIASPYVYNGEIYFEGDNGDVLIGDELYKITTEGSVVLVKDINVDPDDTTPNSDPKRFIEYKGKLYFTANDGDVTGHDIELWVTDGTDAGTQMVYDIQPGLTKGSNPQEYFVFNDNLYFQPNDGSSTQWWKYNGIDVPVKVTNINGGLYASPTKAIVDNANNIVYFQANNPKTALHVMKTDETVELIDINPGGFGYNGSEAILYKGKLIFQGDDGTNGDELWISDGTFAGTSMILDINTTAAGNNSDPESFAIYNDTLYFVADPGTGTQLWKTDGTAAGTKLVAEPNAGMEGSVEELYVYNDKLYFAADDGTNGIEIWVYDGSTAVMLKNINVTGDSNPAGFIEVDGLLFFEANDGSGTKLWVSDGTAERTMSVGKALFNEEINQINVNSSEFAVIGTKLYYTADDLNGDDFFMVDARDLFSVLVTFVVEKGGVPVEGAEITIDGETMITNAEGHAIFEFPRLENLYNYTVYKDESNQTTGSFSTVPEVLYNTVNVQLDVTSLDKKQPHQIKIYPNPAKDYIMIDGVFNKVSYRIYDLSQRCVQEGYLYDNKINLRLNPGLYIIRITENSKESVQKIIIE